MESKKLRKLLKDMLETNEYMREDGNETQEFCDGYQEAIEFILQQIETN